ncbi:hypothetical protein BK138_32140 [Paenibacillus rhizosphaerae]|uniref:Mannosylglycerate hydrolase MGH1-like glycoside hydrolase domain-containing protein n=2 Tax=Paenibacillus TaxID=44249 RepID=A0A1R1E653_9BACL|nr:hypothetical protein BK138_32140 [Paenibacillus rhizosphaerae]
MNARTLKKEVLYMSAYLELQQSLASGWNTWHTRSVLTHVLLPHGLAIQLGIKEYREGRYLRECLIGRQGQGVEVVRPGIRSYDGNYTELLVIWQDIELQIQSAADGEDLVLLITPLRNQPVPALLVAECGFLWNRRGITKHGVGSDRVEADCGHGEIRIYPTSPIVEECHLSANSPYLAQRLTGAVGLSAGSPRTLDEIKAIVSRNKKGLQDSRSKYGKSVDIYNAMQTCLAWDTIYDPKNKRVITPVSRIWNDQGYKLFCWDTYFAAYMCMEDQRALAYANAIEMTRSAVKAGFVPNYDWSGMNVSLDRSQPPVGAFIILQLYRKYGERWLLEEVFEKLCAWNDWWKSNRQIQDGLLAWGSNPMEPVTGNRWETDGVNDTFGAALESGLDNSPMYDLIPFNKEKNVLELADAGLMGLYIMDCLALADIADILGAADRASDLRNRADRFGKGLQQLWDEESGIFRNLRTDSDSFSERLSPTLFYPMLTPYVTEKQVERMINEHLYNPDEFWGEWILPSISRNDPAYGDQDYWRGRIWAPMNLLVYLGLVKQGKAEAASRVAEKSASLILKEWVEHGHVHENYNGSTGEGCDVQNSDRYYHWGGLLAFIALMDQGVVPQP